MESLSLLGEKTYSVPKTDRVVYTNIYNNSIYKGHYDFKLNKNLGSLRQVYIKATISTGGVASTVNPPFALRLLKKISLKCGGSVLHTLTPSSQIARLDLIYETSLYKRVFQGMQPVPSLSSGESVVYIPCFFFFSDKEADALSLYGKDDMYIDVETNDNFQSMGMDTSLTKLNLELHCQFQQTKEPIYKPIVDAYDNFTEPITTVPIGASSVRILLTCPYAVFNTHIALKDIEKFSYQINRVVLESPTSTILDVDFRENYLMSQDFSFNDDSTFTLNFGDRFNDKNFIKFSQEMTPTYLTLYFEPDAILSYIYIVQEYRSKIRTTESGTVLKEMAGIFF